MTVTDPHPTTSPDAARIIRDNMWLHFTPHTGLTGADVPVIVRGDGAYIWDSTGRRYLDGLAGLFAVQVGHGREELAEAAARQTRELAYFPLWGYAHPTAIELAERLANAAPGDLNRVFFTVSGGESVETAWKLIRQYFKATGKPTKHKVISRSMAYHGTSMGALSITGIPGAKADFEPLVPSTQRVPHTNFYRATEHADDYEAYGRWAADRIEEAILFEGPDTVAAVFLEPVQNTGGCFVPPPGYFQRVREICDRHDVLLVSDEVICAFGRLGYDFGAKRFGYQPDIVTTAKGLTSGYAPLGAVLISDRIMEPFQRGSTFLHGSTYGGHPVSCAVALANLDLMEREDLYGHVRAKEAAFRGTLEKLYDLPIVGDVRGTGFFYAVELVKDKATKEKFTDEDATRILKGHVSHALFEAGLHCRADDRAEPVIQLAPPLICDQQQFDEMERALRYALTGAWQLL
ncbi:aspartate aminotransferase family protein [Nocardia arthritidis]|uniref:Aspartate aminotransferase family protein n=1 Tax=Nocardia arthritidis TaxID=228602 RepID=A0A6G9YDV7_9NOCA|nr:aspartate aminotransferase family protein [Nocardia arthritidis]QIS11411.1 aspartate aminotransferase family protein [Nocardia arthritidis]